MKTNLSKFFAFFGVILTLLLSGTPVLALDNQNPYLLMQQVADNTFKRITADQPKIAANPNHLKTIVKEELMPYIDHRFAGMRILYKINATDSEKDAFYHAFEQYLVTTYATVFAKFNNQKVVFASAEPFADKRMVMVKTKLVGAGMKDIDIDFKVLKNKVTNSWKAFDLQAMGVSLLDSKRAELIGLLRQPGGVTKVTQLLLEKANSDITRENAA